MDVCSAQHKRKNTELAKPLLTRLEFQIHRLWRFTSPSKKKNCKCSRFTCLYSIELFPWNEDLVVGLDAG